MSLDKGMLSLSGDLVFSEVNITIDELKSHPLLWGDLMWKKASGKTSCVGICGSFVNFKVVEKLFENNCNLYLETYIDEELISEMTAKFDALKNCEFERDRVPLRKEISEKFLATFYGETRGSLIDWTIITYKCFYNIPKEIETVYFEKNTELFQRSTTIASVSIFLAMISGYMSWEFLKKMYNSVLVIDYDLVDSGLYISELNEIDEHRLKSSSAFSNASMNKYRTRDFGSLDKSIESVTGSIPAFEKIAHFNHEEVRTGTGPLNVFDSELSDLHKIVSFSEALFPYTSGQLTCGDATGILKKVILKIEGHYRIKKVIDLEYEGAA